MYVSSDDIELFANKERLQAEWSSPGENCGEVAKLGSSETFPLKAPNTIQLLDLRTPVCLDEGSIDAQLKRLFERCACQRFVAELFQRALLANSPRRSFLPIKGALHFWLGLTSQLTEQQICSCRQQNGYPAKGSAHYIPVWLCQLSWSIGESPMTIELSKFDSEVVAKQKVRQFLSLFQFD